MGFESLLKKSPKLFGLYLIKIRYFSPILILVLSFVIYPVNAHHPWEGPVTEFSVVQGFLSGLAHPILGVDHFLFLLSIGLLSVGSPIKYSFRFLLIGLLGALFSQVSPSLSSLELLMGLSLFLSAYIANKKINPNFMLPLIFVHGYFLGQVMVGAEPSSIFAYLIGLCAIEFILILIGIFTFKKLSKYKEYLYGILIGSGFVITQNILFR